MPALFYFQMRGIEPREFEGKNFPHALGEFTRGLALS
jgi:hypothetical protein